MNWLLIVVVLFLAIYIYRGYHNGFIKTVFSIVAVAIALIVASIGSPLLCNALQSNETIYSYVNEKVENTLKIDEQVNGKSEQVEIIEHLPLPESIRDSLIENNYVDMYSNLSVQNFSGYVSAYVARMIFNAISYTIVFIVALLAVRIVANILDVISKLPLLNGINKMGGLVVGLAHGLIILWVWCIVLTIFSGTNVGKVLFEQINASPVLSFIYNNNVFIDLLTGIARSLLAIKSV